jgi:hypothetical protein
MGWDKGRYYTRSTKVKGRVVREYVGTGVVAELAAQMDNIKRQNRDFERAILRAEKAELTDLDDRLNELSAVAELLARAALLVAGFRQHKRGEWRKKRDNRNRGEQASSRRPERTTGTDLTCTER